MGAYLSYNFDSYLSYHFKRWGSHYDHGTDEVRGSLIGFAAQKLLCTTDIPPTLSRAQTYAVLSQRLALDINSTTHLMPDSPLQMMQSLHDQVANHLRVCVAIGHSIETLYAVASSEPMLSEAASHVMQTASFSMHEALGDVLSGFSISQGDHGELVVAALFTCARDIAVQAKPSVPIGQLCHYFSVLDLFRGLFSEKTCDNIMDYMPSLCHSETARVAFKTAFADTHMHFNHFIKPQEKILSRGYLMLYLARGAAALGANCQPGFDAVYPFLYGGTDLVRKRVGFIIVQVKNRSNANRNAVFRGMDPFGCQIIDTTKDLENQRFPIPIIRLFFSLAQKSSSVVGSVQYNLPADGVAKSSLDVDGYPTFTSYDIECYGISPELFRPVESKTSDNWLSLINRSPWASLYDDNNVADVVRAQLPGSASHTAHWTHWVEGLEDII